MATEYMRIEDQIESQLLKARRLFLSGPVDTELANEIIRKLWYLEMVDAGKPITLVINSPGGSVDAGMAIWDQIKMVTAPVTTVVTGMAASMGSVLSLVASPGKRFATAYARIMMHQPSIGSVVRGQATDLEIQAIQIEKMLGMLLDLYQGATGKNRDELAKLIDRDYWMSAQEALAFGLLDKIVTTY